MQTIDAATVNALLDESSLVTALDDAFRAGAVTPVRHHHSIPMDTDGAATDATLLLMPAWDAQVPPRHIGVKTITVHPDNPSASLPSVQGVYLLLDGPTGTPRALIDGPALTARRTAAASALAARYLARADAQHLVMIGTGRLAPELIKAHSAERPISRVSVWGRSRDRAAAIAEDLADQSFAVTVCEDLEAGICTADIVSCATTASTPVFDGAWLRSGTHVDLVGGFRPDMREADDTTIGRARIFVDTRAGATAEAGDIVQPIKAGVLGSDGIAADLFDLCRGDHPGRRSNNEITLFKSVGTAIEDLAAAELLIERVAS
ncbi:MAG: ornithine cyclodeaminase [Alphaproteobacteria bacterium]|nr:ornithine cyclodeaminase [Alphaproteobacteria bacterium]